MFKFCCHFVALFTCLGCCLSSAHADITVTDDAGRTVNVKQPARRIVSLSPHTTELLFSAGAGDYVVAVSAFSDFPEQAKKLPVISGGTGVDIERILGFEPDLVVAWLSGNSRLQLKKLESLGLTVFYSEPVTIEGIASNIESLGLLSGTSGYASQIAAQFKIGVDQLSSTYQNAPEMSAFFQIWNPPLMTIGGRHLISQWMALCGVRNVFAEESPLALVVSKESVLLSDPDVLISGQYGLSIESFQNSWGKWKHLRANVSEKLIVQDATVLARQVPRALDSAIQLCQALDQFRPVHSSATKRQGFLPAR
ncbi:MAG: cobalamin-binding protein [Gammaproteobacteria bacterium]